MNVTITLIHENLQRWILVMDIIKKFINKKHSDMLQILGEQGELERKFPTGVQCGAYWNAIEWIEGKAHRRRVDCLILNSLGQLFIFNDHKKTAWYNPLKFYRVPGGSLEKNLTLEEVASLESKEEAGIVIPPRAWKNSGLSYTVKVPWKKDKIAKDIFKQSKVKMVGGKTYIMIGTYLGKTDESAVEAADNDMYKYGKFVDIETVSNILFKEHKQALNAHLNLNLSLNEEYVEDEDDDEINEYIEPISKIHQDLDAFEKTHEYGIGKDDELTANFIKEGTNPLPITAMANPEQTNYFLQVHGYNLRNFFIDMSDHFGGLYKGTPISDPERFSLDQIKEGLLYEREHSEHIPMRLKITLDHLTENPQYYSFLRSKQILPLSEDFKDGFADEAKRRAIKGDHSVKGLSKAVQYYLDNKFPGAGILTSELSRYSDSGVASIFEPWGPYYNFLLDDTSKEELAKGILVEREHTQDLNKTMRIALDHLLVHHTYYTVLEEAEKEAESYLSEDNLPTRTLKDILGVEEQLKINDFDKLYDEVIKDRIENGKLYIYFTNSGTSLSKAIVAVTKDPFNHVGIAFDKKLETMISFDIKGGGLVYQHPLISFNRTTIFELHVINITKEDTRVIFSFLKKLSTSNKYNFSSLLKSYILGFESQIIDKKGIYHFTCATFVYFILTMIGVEFNFKEKISPSKVAPYDILKYIKKDRIKFVKSGNLFEYYYKCFGIRNDNVDIWRYGVKIIDSAVGTTKDQKVSILGNKVTVFPMNESFEDTQTLDEVGLNREDKQNHRGVSAVFKHPNDERVLILYHEKFKGWCLPMGKVSTGETLLSCLHREMEEELGISIQHATPIHSFKAVYQVGENHQVAVDNTIFQIDRYAGKITNLEPHKHSAMKWASLSTLARLDNALDNVVAYLDITSDDLLDSVSESTELIDYVLQEKQLTAAERNELSEDKFGYVDKEGKAHYPLHDANHVRAAIAMFKHCPKEYKDVLRKKLMRKAKMFGVHYDKKKLLSVGDKSTNIKEFLNKNSNSFSIVPNKKKKGITEVSVMVDILSFKEINEWVAVQQQNKNVMLTEVQQFYPLFTISTEGNIDPDFYKKKILSSKELCTVLEKAKVRLNMFVNEHAESKTLGVKVRVLFKEELEECLNALHIGSVVFNETANILPIFNFVSTAPIQLYGNFSDAPLLESLSLTTTIYQ
jgi:8-oxo-dGTP pyrophosphatase MutT (NUDIX family)